MSIGILQLRSRLGELRADVKWTIRAGAMYCRAWINRKRLKDVIFIGITGSAGKTTAKDLCAAILERVGPCHRNLISANEHYHIDRTVASASQQNRFCVVEASAGKPGYLDRSLRMIQPRIGAITLIAREHYSAFKSLEAIAEEKAKLVAALPPDGIAVLNIDDPLVRAIGERHHGRIIWVGRDERATVRLLDCSSRWPDPLTLRVMYEGRVAEVRTRLHGTHLALPVMTAIGMGLAAGATLDDAVAALAETDGSEARMQIESGDDGVVFVRDDWKAPQWSLQAPFDFIRDARAPRKVIVIGTISDSPKSPTQRYAHAARDALKVSDLVVLIGTPALSAVKFPSADGSDPVKAFATVRDAADFLRAELRAGDLVLLKGTAKQDHLARLMFDRRRPVQCWRTACGVPSNCDQCPLLYQPVGAALDSSPAPETGTNSQGAAVLPGNGPIVIGLGNPGAQYSRTPHNAGYRIVDTLVEKQGGAWGADPEGVISTVELEGVVVTLLKPSSNINSVGPLIERFLARSGRAGRQCTIIHDDMDLELGTCRVKRSGGDGGHKGVRSIITALGTDEFQRLRIGVRRAGDARGAKNLVLANLSSADEAVLQGAMDQAESALRAIIRDTVRNYPSAAEHAA